jgi:hypothetical protein
MKYIYLTLFTLLFIGAKAQNNFQWADTGAVWHHTYNWIGLQGYQKSTYIGDTVINNQSCQIIYSEGRQAWPQSNGTSVLGAIQSINLCYLYQSNDSVFTYRNNTFYLAFKTNATVGEIWDLGEYNFIITGHAYVKVDSVYYQNYNGIGLRNIHVFPCKINGDSVQFGSADTNFVSYHNTINEKFGPYGSFTVINQAGLNNVIDETMPQAPLCYQSATFPFYQFNNADCFNNLYVGIKENENNKIELFPNPAQNELFVSNLPNNTHVKFYNVQGQLVLTKSIQKTNIDISTLPIGLYFYTINDRIGSAIQTGKFIKN